MKLLEAKVVNFEEGMDFRKIKLREEDSLDNGNGTVGIVSETNYKRKRVVGYRVVRKEEDGGIVESGYGGDKETGRLTQYYSGIHYWMNIPFPFRRSYRYPELNKLLKKRR